MKIKKNTLTIFSIIFLLLGFSSISLAETNEIKGDSEIIKTQQKTDEIQDRIEAFIFTRNQEIAKINENLKSRKKIFIENNKKFKYKAIDIKEYENFKNNYEMLREYGYKKFKSTLDLLNDTSLYNESTLNMLEELNKMLELNNDENWNLKFKKIIEEAKKSLIEIKN